MWIMLFFALVQGVFTLSQNPLSARYEAWYRSRAKKEKEALIAKIEPKKKECASIGFEPGTEKMAESILKLLEMEGNEDIAKNALLLGAAKLPIKSLFIKRMGT